MLGSEQTGRGDHTGNNRNGILRIRRRICRQKILTMKLNGKQKEATHPGKGCKNPIYIASFYSDHDDGIKVSIHSLKKS
jgi:hypothetical protein